MSKNTSRHIKILNEELFFSEEDTIVSKTDIKGRITYANEMFCKMAERDLEEVLDQPHNIIRHPHMPRCVFKLVWDTILSGSEIFAYVKNLSSTGRFYWVIAHITPTFDNTGKINGFHSNRRKPNRSAIADIATVYRDICRIENSDNSRKSGLELGTKALNELITANAKNYDEFIWKLGGKYV